MLLVQSISPIMEPTLPLPIGLHSIHRIITVTVRLPTIQRLRCDNPLATTDVPAPTIMSTFTLDSMLAYKGADNANNNKAYGFLFQYKDTPFIKNCIDPYTQLARDCAGEHVLSEMTPAVYQAGAQHTLKSVEFHYTTRKDTYYDSSQTSSDGTQQFQTQHEVAVPDISTRIPIPMLAALLRTRPPIATRMGHRMIAMGMIASIPSTA